jgi:hypothetical protein
VTIPVLTCAAFNTNVGDALYRPCSLQTSPLTVTQGHGKTHGKGPGSPVLAFHVWVAWDESLYLSVPQFHCPLKGIPNLDLEGLR